MNLLALPDIHQDLRRLDALAAPLAQADVVLLVGDLTNATGAAGAAQVIEAFRAHNPSVLAVPGNWDDPAACAYLDSQGVSIDRRHRIIKGVAFAGVGGALPAPSRTPNERSETQLVHDLAQAVDGLDPATPLVLVCHQPPLRTRADQTWGGGHAGSAAVRSFIEQRQPLICFCGHIHEGVGIDQIGSTQIANPGPLWMGGYAWAEVVGGSVSIACRTIEERN